MLEKLKQLIDADNVEILKQVFKDVSTASEAQQIFTEKKLSLQYKRLDRRVFDVNSNLLFYAIQGRHKNTINYFLTFPSIRELISAQFTYKGDFGDKTSTLLHLAIETKDLEIVQLICRPDLGVDVNFCSTGRLNSQYATLCQGTPIATAIRLGCLDIFNFLCDVPGINMEVREGKDTLLHIAAEEAIKPQHYESEDRLKLINALFSKRAELAFQKNGVNKTPIQLLIDGNLTIIKDMNSKLKELIDADNVEELRQIFEVPSAVFENSIAQQIFTEQKLSLQYKRLDRRVFDVNSNLLFYAIQGRHKNTINYFLTFPRIRELISAQFTYKGDFGDKTSTLLHLAIETKDLEIVQLICRPDLGVDVNFCSTGRLNGQYATLCQGTPIATAIRLGCLDIFNFLCDVPGINMEVREGKDTLLHIAAEEAIKLQHYESEDRLKIINALFSKRAGLAFQKNGVNKTPIQLLLDERIKIEKDVEDELIRQHDTCEMHGILLHMVIAMAELCPDELPRLEQVKEILAKIPAQERVSKMAMETYDGCTIFHIAMQSEVIIDLLINQNVIPPCNIIDQIYQKFTEKAPSLPEIKNLITFWNVFKDGKTLESLVEICEQLLSWGVEAKISKEGYNLFLMSIESGTDLPDLSQRANYQLPVLVKKGDEIYVKTSGALSYMKLEVSKLRDITFPSIGADEDIVLKEQVTQTVYDEIKSKADHTLKEIFNTIFESILSLSSEESIFQFYYKHSDMFSQEIKSKFDEAISKMIASRQKEGQCSFVKTSAPINIIYSSSSDAKKPFPVVTCDIQQGLLAVYKEQEAFGKGNHVAIAALTFIYGKKGEKRNQYTIIVNFEKCDKFFLSDNLFLQVFFSALNFNGVNAKQFLDILASDLVNWPRDDDGKPFDRVSYLYRHSEMALVGYLSLDLTVDKITQELRQHGIGENYKVYALVMDILSEFTPCDNMCYPTILGFQNSFQDEKYGFLRKLHEKLGKGLHIPKGRHQLQMVTRMFAFQEYVPKSYTITDAGKKTEFQLNAKLSKKESTFNDEILLYLYDSKEKPDYQKEIPRLYSTDGPTLFLSASSEKSIDACERHLALQKKSWGSFFSESCSKRPYSDGGGEQQRKRPKPQEGDVEMTDAKLNQEPVCEIVAPIGLVPACKSL